MKLYAIGDIHGCYNALEDMLSLIHKDRNGEPAKIVFLGDYVDRGPDSYDVVQYLIDLSNMKNDNIEYVFLKGNHEDMLLHSVENPSQFNDVQLWMINGGKQTNMSYAIAGKNMEDHLDFYQNLKLIHRHKDYVFVHANIDPELDWDKQDASICLWDRSYNNYDGEYKGGVKTVVHGHTPVKITDVKSHQINIDTGCVFKWMGHDDYSGLTGIRLEDDGNHIVFKTTEYAK